MQTYIPSSAEVRKRLQQLPLDKVAEASGISLYTLQKIRDAITSNPRLETVRRLWPHIR